MDTDIISNKVLTWCSLQKESKRLKGEIPGYSFEFLSFIVNVHRLEAPRFTRVSLGVAMELTDLEFYNMIGESRWRSIVRNTNAVLSRSELRFIEVPGLMDSNNQVPAYEVSCKMYD